MKIQKEESHGSGMGLGMGIDSFEELMAENVTKLWQN